MRNVKERSCNPFMSSPKGELGESFLHDLCRGEKSAPPISFAFFPLAEYSYCTYSVPPVISNTTSHFLDIVNHVGHTLGEICLGWHFQRFVGPAVEDVAICLAGDTSTAKLWPVHQSWTPRYGHAERPQGRRFLYTRL